MIKLIASARAPVTATPLVAPTGWTATVLARCAGWEMGIGIRPYGSMYFKDLEGNPLPTAAAMLRDAVNLFA